MKLHWKYFCYVAKHKWFVFLAGIKLGVPLWALIIHDWQKYTPTEWTPYIDYFYRYPGKKDKPKQVKEAFDIAWNHHQKYGPHHWQWWMLVYDDQDEMVIIEMPDRYRREMLADWRGAGRAITGKDDVLEWYMGRRERMKRVLHPATRLWIEQQLGVEQ